MIGIAAKSAHLIALGSIIGMVALSTANVTAQSREPDRAQTQSAGCGKKAARTGVFNRTSTDGDRSTRTYLLQVPADYDAARSYALVFVFHASGGNSAQSYSWGLQNVAGAAESAIFVFPGAIQFRREGIGWDDTSNGRDIPFFDHMLKELQSDYCIETTQVFIAGFSWGGDFVAVLACHRGEQIRAAAANSTDDEFKDNSNYLTYQGLPCSSKVHPPMRFEHALGGDPQYPAPDFATTSKLFQYFNSCSTNSSAIRSSTPVMSCVSYSQCASEYIECTFDHALGHRLPPNWAADTWTFFSKYRNHHVPDAADGGATRNE